MLFCSSVKEENYKVCREGHNTLPQAYSSGHHRRHSSQKLPFSLLLSSEGGSLHNQDTMIALSYALYLALDIMSCNEEHEESHTS